MHCHFKNVYLGIAILTALEVGGQAPTLVAGAPFGDNMVLQRGMPVPVFGTANPGTRVTVFFQEQRKVARAGKDGLWRAVLKPMVAGGPFSLEIKTRGKRIRFREVMVGEVWLCAGQSNMDWSMGQTPPNGDSARHANYPAIRLMDFRGDKKWKGCDPRSALDFSATGYYFGRELWRTLGVPIGLIESAEGGTPVERWLSSESLREDSLLANDPSQNDLYRAHIAPLIGFGIRGVIWYQGESNIRNHTQYASRFPRLIRGWRKAWGQGDFPFHYAQLQNFLEAQTDPNEDGGWPRLRETQRKTLSIPNTAMAVTLDLNVANEAHPKNKFEVGRRLSLSARALVYGEPDLVYSGPMYQSMTVEGRFARLVFRLVGAGLRAKGGGEVKGFVVAASDGKYHWAKASVQGNQVVVSSPEVPSPVSVRYGWANNPEVNLENSEGLPASPFTTESGTARPTATLP